MHVSTCAHLCSYVSCLGTNLAQILCNLRFLWMMEYKDPQLTFNLLTILFAVICMSSQTRVFTHSALSTIHDVVWQLEHQQCLFCHFGTFPTTGTPSFAQYSCICIVLTLFCDLKGILHLLTTKNHWQHTAQQWWNLKVELTCLHYERILCSNCPYFFNSLHNFIYFLMIWFQILSPFVHFL
jgi:hypothetical protein